MVLQVIYIIVLGFSGILSNQKKELWKLTLILFYIYLFFLTAFSYTNNDATVYATYWQASKETFFTKDIGFGVLFAIAHFFGLSYEVFRFFVYLLGFTLLHLSIRNLSKKNEIYVLLIYFIYPFFLDNIEMRNFLAYMFLIYAITFLVRNNVKDTLIAFFLLALGSLFHKIAFIYFVPFIMWFIFKNNLKHFVLYFDILFIFLCIVSLNKNLFISFLNSLPEWFKSLPGIDRNLVSDNDYGWIINLTQVITLYVSTRLMIHQVFKQIKREIIKRDSYAYRYCCFVYIITSFACFLVPFYIISADFMRVTRNTIILNATTIVYLLFLKKHNKFICFETLSLYFLLITLGIDIIVIFRGDIQFQIIYDTFINNYLFNLGELKYDMYNRFIWRSENRF